ncbi:MAG: thioredoxin family protein [Saprospiraceae bacterium]
MALSKSTMLSLGTEAPNFSLQDTVSGRYLSLDDLASDQATVIMFICNHCPFVIHINSETIKIANEYRNKGVAFIAISSNDANNYPEDTPDKMSIVAKVLKFPFPYLYDKRQTVARDYGAVCTPDFYIFDGKRNLTYRGRLDQSRPGNDIALTGEDLRNAIDKTIAEETIEPQHPSVGCAIKWLG